MLMNMAQGLHPEYQSLLTRARAQLLRLTGDDAGKFGEPHRKSEVLDSGSESCRVLSKLSPFRQCGQIL